MENKETDPYYNLALEQVVFDNAKNDDSYFMLWQNNNAVIIGKHQNTLEEINAAFVKEHNITVARRLSGGGAVYHDMGNLNFTIISPVTAANKQSIDFSYFARPVSKALLSLGVPVEISGRNDMTVEGKKFSGNAQYIKNNRVMHHGTILYDSNLDILSKALKAKDKVESKAVKSKESMVTNIRPYMKNDMCVNEFWLALKNSFYNALDTRDLPLKPEYHKAAIALKEKVYSKWDWNYGNSPPHTLRKTRRIPGCGKIDIFMDMGREGIINNIVFYGDFFENRDPAELGNLLAGHHLEYGELKSALLKTDISKYIHALDTKTFLSILFE